MKSVTFLYKPKNIGGPGTFQKNFSKYCRQNGVSIFLSTEHHVPQNILVISGSKKLLYILIAKYFNGAQVIQRLDGFEFLRFKKYGLVRSLKNKIQFLLIVFTMLFISDKVIFQSQFVKNWWRKKLYHFLPANSVIIHNGFNQSFGRCVNRSNKGNLRFISVEGAIKVDQYTKSLFHAYNEVLRKRDRGEYLEVYGVLEGKFSENFSNIKFKGRIERKAVVELYTSGRPVFVLLERHAACPNSLVEAIGAGVPSIGSDDGSFKELSQEAGLSINSSFILSNPAELHRQLENRIAKIDERYDRLFELAKHQSKSLSLSIMMDKYLESIGP